jgi:hypothetical protein
VTDGIDVSAVMLRAVDAAERAVQDALKELSPEEAADALDILRDRLLRMLNERAAP